MAGSVQSIDLEDPSRITLRYLDRFDVVLKKDDDFDYRLNYLAAVIGRLDGSDQGTIQWDKDGQGPVHSRLNRNFFREITPAP